MLIAPATANIIAKIAHGLCDDIVSLLVNASACPVVFAPAMNNRMWENAITKENVAKLQSLDYRFIGPDSGWLACRNVGPGRMSEAAKNVAESASVMRLSLFMFFVFPSTAHFVRTIIPVSAPNGAPVGCDYRAHVCLAGYAQTRILRQRAKLQEGN